jgi:hypothetical protein
VKHLLKELAARSKSAATYQKTHKLQDNWKLVVQEAEASKLKLFDSTEMGIVSDIIEEFCKIDPTGQVFRYPEDIKGSVHLEDLGVINVEVLANGMTILYELFEKWRHGLDRLHE